MRSEVKLWDVETGENSKAKRRRINQGFFDKYCFGHGCEVGSSQDPIIPGVKVWDTLSAEENSYDFVYSSVLHEQADPYLNLMTWFRSVRPDGYLILYVPSRDMFEKKLSPPSRFSRNTKSFWSLENNSEDGNYNVLKVIEESLHDYRIVRAELCDEGYGSISHDSPSWGEYSYEVVIKKLRPAIPTGRYEMPEKKLENVKNSGNWSIMRHADRWHAVARVDDIVTGDEQGKRELTGKTNASLVYAQLDDNFDVVSKRPLIVTPNLSCEDPRLFVYRDKLHVAYNGASYSPPSFRQHIATLHEGQVTSLFSIERSKPTDKNWMYFEKDRNLYAVHSIDPHVIIRIDGDKIEEVARTYPNIGKKAWWYGEPRGGSCPWYIGNDEYLTFFQSHYIPYGFYRRVYVIGAYVFSAKPPFEVKRITRQPLLVPAQHDANSHSVIFPCGSVYKDSEWLVSFGCNDKESRLARFSRLQLDSALTDI